ncbi:E3 ubiquitin-protein ligase TRIM39-like [Aquarana catesbeiana]|uniref:E3 ubiquitin-protein ligase TRIM39-like n=1 Tax=Aquarana catesbeiana TaxID=8400 RepID=UPI003CC93CF8
MASSDLREELDCPVCLNTYTDPVTLRCGHNFCQVCIDRVLETQEGSGNYSCPQCRRKFRERPSLERNITLCKITQRFLSAPPEPEKSGISCTYCLHTSVPAAKSCLLCEVSLCYDHLRVHSRSPEHVLCGPTTTPEKRKCSVHKKILEFYCNEDSTLTCAFCVISEEHRGHQVETLKGAFLKKKIKLLHDGVDPARISHMINTGLANKRTSYISGIHIQKTVDILDVDTAHDVLCISPDKKIADITDALHKRPDTTGRFKKYYQVLGSRSFSSGRQYWEVDVDGSSKWKIGMCYASIARDGDDSLVGCNDVSWGLHCWDEDYMAMHDNIDTELPGDFFGSKVRVYLDYEAGQLSFYMGAPLRHLHTFSATFTEPLYAVLCVEDGFLQI